MPTKWDDTMNSPDHPIHKDKTGGGDWDHRSDTSGAKDILKYETERYPDTAKQQQQESQYISDKVPRRKE